MDSSPAIPDPTLGVYVHIPFCRARCSYCAFYTVSHDESHLTSFADALVLEMERTAAAGRVVDGVRVPSPAHRVVDTIYIGGGTPSLVPPDHLERALAVLRSCFDVREDAEITLEANPETVTPDSAAAWRRLGFGRVSLGAQTFSDQVLARVGRRHEARTITDAVDFLRRYGPEIVSLDLIAGLEPATFLSDLRSACMLMPDHLSVYLLEVDEAETGRPTGLSRQVDSGWTTVPEDDWYADVWPRAVELLQDHGLHRYEVCNFARPGRECRHNLKYWLCREVIGFGPSAHSLVGDVRYANDPDWTAWAAALRRGSAPPGRVDSRSPAQVAAERAILGLRLRQGVPNADLARWLVDARPGCGERTLDELATLGLVENHRDRTRLTDRGVLLSNEIFERFLPDDESTPAEPSER